jgi:hypothetical protein
VSFSHRPKSGYCAVASIVRVLVLSALSIVVLPAAFAQHGGHGGGSHASAPHMSAPHASAPHNAPAQTPRPTYRAPTSGDSAYRGAVPTNRFTPTPIPPGPPAAYRPGSAYPGQRAAYNAPSSNRGGPHLGNWLQNHQGESPASQENALRREPGFNRLPPQQQQRLIDRLHHLNSLTPQDRQRLIGLNENMERLSPERRQAVRNSVQEYSTMNPARKDLVRGAYRVLRDMPPAQREHVLNSPAYRSMYSDHERQMLGNMLSVEPYEPR